MPSPTLKTSVKKKGCIKKRVSGKNQQCAVASLDDNLEQPLDMCLDFSPHMDNLNSDWDNSTPDNSPPTGVSLDSQKSSMDISASGIYFPSDRPHLPATFTAHSQIGIHPISGAQQDPFAANQQQMKKGMLPPQEQPYGPLPMLFSPSAMPEA